MASFSNGQRESSHSGDSSSSSSSDSDEQRFDANVNASQRQHSSTTSASSSDSEQEEVSTRPAPEKPAATPLLKRKPNSSDRSAVRNQSTPSEANPNTKASASNPNTLSAAQPKKGVAAKRDRDDDFAEEQPESKRKKSVSKTKKVTQEEVAAASNPSNTSRKRLRKHLLLESPSPVPRVTCSARHPQEKSSKKKKKKVRVWTTNEESDVMQCCLKYAMEGLELSKVARKIKDSLDIKASNVQVYEKLRRMLRRYRSIKSKMAQVGIKEDAFLYKSPHEKELYKVWKEAWGEQHEEDEMELHHTDASGDEAKEEEEVERDGCTDTVKEPKVRSTQKAPVANHIPAKSRVSSRLIPNNKSEDGLHYETILKKTGDLLAEVIGEVRKMAETSEAELKASLISHLWPSLANGNFRSQC